MTTQVDLDVKQIEEAQDFFSRMIEYHYENGTDHLEICDFFVEQHNIMLKKKLEMKKN